MKQMLGFHPYFDMRHNKVGTVVGLCGDLGITIRYGLGGPGIEFRWGRVFRTRSDRPGDHSASSKMSNGSRSRGQGGQGVALTNHPILVPRLKKE